MGFSHIMWTDKLNFIGIFKLTPIVLQCDSERRKYCYDVVSEIP